MTPLFQGFRGLASIAAAGLLLWTGSIRVAAQRAPAASAEKHAQTAGQPNSSSGEPVHLSSEQERERELRLLGIRDVEMRPRSSPDARAPNAANYDEAKADVYPTLPDPLVLHDGQRVTSAAMWWKKRRPEIVAEFDREILGYMPKHLQIGRAHV